MPSTPTLAVLGLGQMGAPIARRLLPKSRPMTLWNRRPEKSEVFAGGGARVADTATEAVSDAQIVFTMLTDDHAVEDVFFNSVGQPGILTALKPSTIHVTLSTLSTCILPTTSPMFFIAPMRRASPNKTGQWASTVLPRPMPRSRTAL